MINPRERITPTAKEINEQIQGLEDALKEANPSTSVITVIDSFWASQDVSLAKGSTRQEVASAAIALSRASEELGLNKYGVRNQPVGNYFANRASEETQDSCREAAGD